MIARFECLVKSLRLWMFALLMISFSLGMWLFTATFDQYPVDSSKLGVQTFSSISAGDDLIGHGSVGTFVSSGVDAWSKVPIMLDSSALQDWPRNLIVADIGPILDADAVEVDRPLARVGSIGEPIDADDEGAEALRQYRVTGSIGEPLNADDELAERVITGRTGNIGELIDVESLLQ